jgi:iron complex outermembrane receptor protein
MKKQNIKYGAFILIASMTQPSLVLAQGEVDRKLNIGEEAVVKKRRVLEEVIVTATKREKSLRDIAGSISAYSGDDLERQAVLSINDILEQSPGVTSNSARPGDQRIIMRGISTTASPMTTAPYPVGIFIGDTSLNEPYAASVTPDLSAFDLAAIEVLKGPQGTLFGGSALAGAVRYRLNDPVTDERQLRYFVQATDLKKGTQALSQGVTVNLPLLKSGNLGMRFTYIDREYPGVFDDTKSGRMDVDEGEGDQIRFGLLWQPVDEFEMKFTYLKQDYEADNGLVIADSPDGPRETRGTLIPWPNMHEFEMINLHAQYDWEHVRIVSSSSRTQKKRFTILDSRATLIGTPPSGGFDATAMPLISEQGSTSIQQEIRLQSMNGETFEWLVGAYYLRSPIRYYLQQNVTVLNDINAIAGQTVQQVQEIIALLGLDSANTSVIQALSDPECDISVLCAETNALAKEVALFFDATWYLWNKWELSLGARYYKTGIDGGFLGRGAAAIVVGQGEYPVDATAEIIEEGVNPKLSVIYNFTDNHAIYALANKGFRFGGLQNVPEDKSQNVPGVYKSDYIWNYELGLRTSWFENQLQLDITAYHIDYSEPLVQLKNNIQINYYDNVGSASSDGYEANLRWLTPIPGIIVNLTGGEVDAKTGEDFRAGNADIPVGTPLPGSAKNQYSANIAFFGSPDWLVNVAGTFGYSYVGKTYNDIVSEDIVNDYGTYNMSVNLSVPSIKGRPSLTLSAMNLKDVTAPVGIGRGAEDFYILNSPRTLTARLSLDFD